MWISVPVVVRSFKNQRKIQNSVGNRNSEDDIWNQYVFYVDVHAVESTESLAEANDDKQWYGIDEDLQQSHSYIAKLELRLRDQHSNRVTA